MIYFHKNAWKTESYRKFLGEDYHHHYHYHHLLVLLPLQHHMNFEKLVIIAKGHFLCMLFFVPVQQYQPSKCTHTHSTTTVYRLILLLAFAIEIGNNRVSYLSHFQRRYAEENILSPFLLLPFPRIPQVYFNGGLQYGKYKL